MNMEPSEKEFLERFSIFNTFILLSVAIDDELNDYKDAKKVREIFKRQNPWAEFFYNTPVNEINYENYRKRFEKELV